MGKNRNMDKKIKVFTDGACSGNPGPGGWAVIIKAAGETPGVANIVIFGEHVPNTTNIEMELLAVEKALAYISDHIGISEIEIFTDSKYVTQTALGKWKVGSHFKTWQLIKDFMSIHNIKFTWISSHKPGLDNIYHEKCDKVAKHLARSEHEKALKEMEEYQQPHKANTDDGSIKRVEMCKMEIDQVLKKWECMMIGNIEVSPLKF